MNLILIAMILALLIPFYEAWKDDDIWQTMLAFASISTKAAVIILFISVLRNDWMIGVVGVIILSVGNAGLMLLAQIIKRINDGIKDGISDGISDGINDL
jgi:multicomponent Na+:H+ antiporter subunit F